MKEVPGEPTRGKALVIAVVVVIRVNAAIIVDVGSGRRSTTHFAPGHYTGNLKETLNQILSTSSDVELITLPLYREFLKNTQLYFI